ncbi:MAG: methyltransferase domain-containing protein [Patescibacteria group bacterium]
MTKKDWIKKLIKILNFFNLVNKIYLKGQSLVVNKWYNHLSKIDSKGEVIFLNYGYQYREKLRLEKIDEENRYCAQLYHKVVSSINIKDKKVLEVGCGKGGGTSFIARYFKPKLIVGIDNSKAEIKFDREHHYEKNLKFEYGNAIKIPFEDESFDAAINIESSHSYPNFNKFLQEAKRILKPKGYFLFADFRSRELIQSFFDSINKSKLKIIKKEDITENVFRALNLDNERRMKLVRQFLPKFLQNLGKQFAGVKDSELCNSFKNGKRKYFYFILQKYN